MSEEARERERERDEDTVKRGRKQKDQKKIIHPNQKLPKGKFIQYFLFKTHIPSLKLPK